jgi:polysaccharide export outer membrane protein
MINLFGLKHKLRREQKGNSLAAACTVLLVVSSLLAAQSPPTLSPASGVVSTPGSVVAARLPTLPECIIGPDDVLMISVYDAPDVTGEYRVKPTGQIQLPLLSQPIVAAGLTADQLSDLISERYRTAEIFGHPRVTVTLKESRVHAITVGGAVKMPQVYPLFGKTTLADVLSQAQGLSDDAGNKALITRGDIAMQILKQSGVCETATSPTRCATSFLVELQPLESTDNAEFNVDLYPGDRVTVQHAGIVYVMGAVNRPGGFPLKAGQEEMTVLQALALAEDLKSTAARKKAMIIRKNPSAKTGRDEIPINLKSVVEGQGPDLRLHASDILYVADSTGNRALRRGAEAAVYVTTGLIIWGR